MAITQVGVSQATSSTRAGTTGISVTRTPGAVGNLLVVAGYTGLTTAVPLLHDSAGNTWNNVTSIIIDSTNAATYHVWWAVANGTSSTTITFTTNSGASQFMAMFVDEFTGTDTTSPFDTSATTTVGASGTNPSSNSIVLGADNCLVWSFIIDTATAVGNIDGSAATLAANDGLSDLTEYRVLTGRSGASVTASWTSSGGYDIVIASFLPPAVYRVAWLSQ